MTLFYVWPVLIRSGTLEKTEAGVFTFILKRLAGPAIGGKVNTDKKVKREREREKDTSLYAI